MNSENLQAIGRREELKLEKTRLEASIKSLQSAIRETLNPYVCIEEMDVTLLPEQSYELAEKVQAYKTVVAGISRINKDLGVARG